MYRSPTSLLSSLLWICLSLIEPIFMLQLLVIELHLEFNTWSMLTINLYCINCVLHMRDEHVDDVSPHTYVNTVIFSYV